MAATHPDAWSEIIAFLAAYWWVAFLFGGSARAAVYEFFHEILKRHHKRRLAIMRERARIAEAVAKVKARREEMMLPYDETKALNPGAGPCKHRSNVHPVFDSFGKRVAWYCASCDTQLPASYAIGAEDL